MIKSPFLSRYIYIKWGGKQQFQASGKNQAIFLSWVNHFDVVARQGYFILLLLYYRSDIRLLMPTICKAKTPIREDGGRGIGRFMARSLTASIRKYWGTATLRVGKNLKLPVLSINVTSQTYSDALAAPLCRIALWPLILW